MGEGEAKKANLEVCLLWCWVDIRAQLGWFICPFCTCGLWLLWRIGRLRLLIEWVGNS